MKPYTYLIKHRPTGKVYYGYRSANKTEPTDDLWKHYFTSSPKVQRLIEETGVDSFDVEIRRVFETKEQASAWETKVLRRCRVLEDDRWINQNVAGYILPTEESRKKISEAHKDKPKTEKHKQNLSKSQKGKPKVNSKNQTPEYRALMSKLKSGPNNPMYGKECTPERAAKIGAANKGKIPANKGVPMSEEQKAKIRATKVANPTKFSKEVIDKRSAKIRGQKRSDETKLKMSLAAKGKSKGPMSEETKLKISQGTIGKSKPEGMGKKLSETVAAQLAAGTHYTQQPKQTCPHCGTKASKARYNAFHGDKCKYKHGTNCASQ